MEEKHKIVLVEENLNKMSREELIGFVHILIDKLNEVINISEEVRQEYLKRLKESVENGKH